ncbi:hypothetical protein [Nocardia sp. NPDC046763]|uniref:hypothetical protein n=1 Tax=Nocardia sp. NPDC046763 TaxID=3155256 RepID=UPI0033D3457C
MSDSVDAGAGADAGIVAVPIVDSGWNVDFGPIADTVPPDTGSSVDSAAEEPTEFSFANLSEVVIAWFLQVDWLGDLGIDMPNPPTLPYLLVTQIPGGTDNRVTARGLVSLDLFANDLGVAITLGRRMHARMLALRNQVVAVGGWPVPIGEIKTLQLPGYSPYSDDPLLMHRVVASYEVRSDWDAQPL